MAWTIDSAHTTIGFSVRHLGISTVHGKFARFTGVIDLDPNDITRASGQVEIETASIDTGQPDRDVHLKGPDFFDVDRFPTITYRVKRVEPAPGGDFKVVGDLTIRDVTREVEFGYAHAGEARDPYGNRKVGGALTGEINRTDWGLKWNAALEAGGWLVGDKVKIAVEGQLAEARQAVEKQAELESSSR